MGEDARQMLGRTPANIIAVDPERGVISDYDVQKDAQIFHKKTCGSGKFFRPRIMVCVPSGVTEVENCRQRSRTQAEAKMFSYGGTGGGGHRSGTGHIKTGGTMVMDSAEELLI